MEEYTSFSNRSDIATINGSIYWAKLEKTVNHDWKIEPTGRDIVISARPNFALPIGRSIAFPKHREHASSALSHSQESFQFGITVIGWINDTGFVIDERD